MWVYWFIFFLAAVMALSRARPQHNHLGQYSFGRKEWLIPFFILTMFIGLRHEVGADWFTYENHIANAFGEAIFSTIDHGDPAYVLLNRVGANFFGGIYFVNSICAALFSWGLLAFCWTQPRPWLALLIALPYLIIVVAMGYTRQGVAIGVVMLGLVALRNRSVRGFILWVIVAAAFHKSAVVLIPAAIFFIEKNRFLTLLGIVASAGAVFFLLVLESIESLSYTYLEREYESSGALIRIVMNVIPSIIFIIFQKRFKLNQKECTFWRWMSLIAICFVPLLIVSPSSTAIDRLALYFIPLQLFVWSRIPDVFGKFGRPNYTWVLLVVAYCTSILFVWLFYAQTAFAWIPYQFYLIN